MQCCFARQWSATCHCDCQPANCVSRGCGVTRVWGLPEPQESLEANDQLDAEAPQQHAPLPLDDPAQAQVEAALRDEPVDGSVVVDGVTLSLANTLSSLRQAARNLGLGRSGGKQTVLKRIRDHLSRQQLIASHPACSMLDQQRSGMQMSLHMCVGRAEL